jgi:hypothetical protein
MKWKIGLIAVIVAGFMASFAVAASPNKGGAKKTTTTTAKVKKAKKTCRPNVSLIMKGKLVSVDGASFTMNVTKTNKHAKSYKGKTITVLTNAKTKIRRLGKKVTLDKLVAGETNGDTLNVRARYCKRGELPAPPLAVRVVAKPAKPAAT